MKFDFKKLANSERSHQGRSGSRQWPEWYPVPHVLPGELAGSLQQYPITCGKAGCKCASGRLEDAHTAVYRVYWQDGRTRRKYVRKADVKAVRAAIKRRNKRLAADRAERNAHMQRGMGKKSILEQITEKQLRDALGDMYEIWVEMDGLEE